MAKVILGGKNLSCFGADPWTGELLSSFVCPKCDKFLGYGFTSRPATSLNYIKFYSKYYFGNLELPLLEDFKHECKIDSKL